MIQKTVYRIRITRVVPNEFFSDEPVGSYSYFSPFPGTGRRYTFLRRANICDVCGDHITAINFATIAEANTRLKTACVKDILEYYGDEGVYPGKHGPPYRLDIVEVKLDRRERYGWCKTSERVVRQIVPEPTILDQLSVI